MQAVEILTPDAVSATRRSDRWGEIVSSAHQPMSVTIPDVACRNGFTATIRRRWIDDISVVETTTDACSGVRDDRCASASGDVFEAVFILSGSERITASGIDRTFGPGEFFIGDCTIPMAFSASQRLKSHAMLIPRSTMESAGGPRWKGNAIESNSSVPSVKLLGSLVSSLLSLSGELSPAANVAARNATIELLLGVVSTAAPDLASMSMRELLWLQLDRWMDAHLREDLSPATAAAAHNVSVRTLHRLYSDADTTFGAVLRNRRLNRARTDLLTTADSVQTIAARWSFSDTSHFHRVFKDAYGMSPSEYRATRR